MHAASKDNLFLQLSIIIGLSEVSHIEFVLDLQHLALYPFSLFSSATVNQKVINHKIISLPSL